MAQVNAHIHSEFKSPILEFVRATTDLLAMPIAITLLFLFYYGLCTTLIYKYLITRGFHNARPKLVKFHYIYILLVIFFEGALIAFNFTGMFLTVVHLEVKSQILQLIIGTPIILQLPIAGILLFLFIYSFGTTYIYKHWTRRELHYTERIIVKWHWLYACCLMIYVFCWAVIIILMKNNLLPVQF